MPWMSKKDQHGLDIAADLKRFFRPRWIWRLPLQRLLLSLRVINMHPCFITGYDVGDEAGVVSGLLFEFPAHINAKGLLVVSQQSWHKSRRSASRVQIVLQNALNGLVWQSYYLKNIVGSLPTICKDPLELLLCFPVLCLSTVVQNAHRGRQMFVRPWSVCTINKVCFGLWNFLRMLSVAFGGFLEEFFLRLKQNLMQILCSVKSVISVVKKFAVSLRQPHKNALNLITRPLSFTTVGTQIHKTYC